MSFSTETIELKLAVTIFDLVSFQKIFIFHFVPIYRFNFNCSVNKYL